jgi:hypothetical protein
VFGMNLYRVWDAHLAHVEKASVIYMCYWQPAHCNTSPCIRKCMVMKKKVVTFWKYVGIWQNVILTGIEIVLHHITHLLFEQWLMYSFIHTVRNLNVYVCVENKLLLKIFLSCL